MKTIVEKKLEFAVMLSLFFPVLLEALFGLSESSQIEVSKITLQAGLAIFILILNYLFFQWQKIELSDRQLDYLNWIFTSTIACFASMVLFFGFLANSKVEMGWISVGFYFFAILGFLYIPVIGLVLISVNFLIKRFKKGINFNKTI